MISRLLVFVFSMYVVLTPTLTYAGAAEDLWKYEPELKDMKIKVTGHKVDALGNAVNDSKYVRTIDPKVGVARTAQGTVGISRLLKISGWGILGTYALEKLLEGVGWVIDPESQSIWRNKKSEGLVGCFVTDPGTGQRLIFKTGEINPVQFEPVNCPLDAANRLIRVLRDQYQGKFEFEFSRWTYYPDPIRVGTRLDFEVKTKKISDGSVSNDKYTLKAQPDPNQEPTAKEELTPDALSDYVNRTHPDFSDPQLAPKLAPNWNDQIAPDLWTPSNKFEEVNSPTVQIAKKELDNANPTSPDPEVKPNPDTGGLTLPSFCDWASVVCDFVKDFKKEPDLPDEQLNIKDENIIDYERKNYVTFGASCPFNVHQVSIPMGLLGEINFDADLTYICTFGAEARPFVVGIGYLGGLIYLLVGLRNGNA